MANNVETIIMQTVNKYLKKGIISLKEFNFEIIENRIFLYIENETGSVLEKRDLNTDLFDFNDLYLSIYQSFKNKYLSSQTERINVLKVCDLLDNHGYYLTLNVLNIHGNRVKLNLKYNPYIKDSLDVIWSDWEGLVNEIKPSKTK